MRILTPLLILSLPAAAQQPLEVRRGDLQVKVRVGGTVVTDDIIRLKSTIEGRVEEVLASTYTWITNGDPLGFLANKEMAAILDSHTTTAKGVLEERWRRVYQPTAIKCPSDCFVLRGFIKTREWLKPRAVLFEAAQRLLLIGRVRPEDAQWVKDGQGLEFWAVKNPSQKLHARINRYVLDFQGNKYEPGGTFTVDLGPGRSLDPGTEWEGLIIPLTKKNVLIVPTDSLIKYNGAVYLPVKVTTGVTTSELTEITAGTDQRRGILVLDDARLKSALRHQPEADPDLVNRRIREEYLKPEPKARKGPSTLSDPDANYGEDPYAE